MPHAKFPPPSEGKQGLSAGPSSTASPEEIFPGSPTGHPDHWSAHLLAQYIYFRSTAGACSFTTMTTLAHWNFDNIFSTFLLPIPQQCCSAHPTCPKSSLGEPEQVLGKADPRTAGCIFNQQVTIFCFLVGSSQNLTLWEHWLPDPCQIPAQEGLMYGTNYR